MHLKEFFSRRGLKTVLRTFLSYSFGKRESRRVHSWRLFYRLRLQMRLRSKEQISKIAKRTKVKIWVDGKEAFPRIAKLINRAKHTIIIQMFIWKDDRTGKRIAKLLVDAADRGVKIDITKDSTGDVFEFKKDFLSTKYRERGVWKQFWNHPNIRISYTNQRNHSKVYVIDSQILLLSGMNIADEYRYSWHDYLVELRGSSFVNHYITEGERAMQEGPVMLKMNMERRKEIRKTIENLISSAQKSIVVEHCYVSDMNVLKLLAKRTHDGVRVTLIIPKKTDLHQHANMRSVQYLLTHANVKKLHVLHYPEIVHGKVMLIDRKTAFIGSANLMESSLDSMGELNVLITGKHRHSVRKLRRILRKDILRSKALLSPPRLHGLGRWLAFLGL